MKDQEQGVAFLDTTALHCIGIYLNFCRKERMDPCPPNDNRTSMNERLAAMRDQDLEKSIRSGVTTIDWLRSKDLQVEYSVVSELELVSGRVHGIALLNAAREGIPDRMWTRFSEDDVQRRVDGQTLRDIADEVGELASQLDELGISKLRAYAGARDVWDLSRKLAGLVYLSPNDNLIYSGALYVEADYLITADNYLRRMVNKVHNSNKAHFREVRDQVRAKVGDALLTAATDVSLPSAFWPPKVKNRPRCSDDMKR